MPHTQQHKAKSALKGTNTVPNISIMGIININRESFYAKSRCLSPSESEAAFIRMAQDGADFIDIGACSTKPGSVPVPEEKEALPALPFELASPIKGEVKPLSACTDLAFASGAMGKGVVIEPTEGKVYAPCDGQVMMLFETLHAIGLKSENGAELLIHVGLDTVKLNGQGFKAYVQGGDSVKKGDLLIEFDIDFIKEKGLSVTTPMVITNADNYADFVPSTGNHLSGDKVLDIIPA